MSIRTIEQLLVETRLFADLPEHHLATIAGCAVTAHFEEGEYVFREGGPADTFYVLRSGSIALETYVPGRGAALLMTIHDQDVLGWSWLFPPYRWHFDARALEPVARSLRRRSSLRQKSTDDHELGYELMRRSPRYRQPSASDAHAAARRLPPRWLSRHAPPYLPEPHRIARKHRETEDTWTFELEPPRAATRFVSHRAVTMVYAFGAGEVPISISGDPSQDDRLVHTVRAVGATTRAICALERGGMLGIRGPYGTAWPLAPAEGGDVVVAAGGIGLAAAARRALRGARSA